MTKKPVGYWLTYPRLRQSKNNTVSEAEKDEISLQ